MAKITMEEAPEFTVIPPDTVIKVKVDECKVTDEDGKFGPWQKLNIKFEILDIPLSGYEDMIGRPVWGSTNFKFNDSPDNQLRQWCEAILGFSLSVGFELDTEDLEGKRCRAVISNYESKKDGKPRHAVDSLLAWVAGDTTDSKPKLNDNDPWAAPAQTPSPQPVAATAGVAAPSQTALDEPPF